MSSEAQHPVNLNTLYQQVILEHYKKPHGKGSLEQPTIRKALQNPTCGDHLTVDLILDEAGKVADVKWEGSGCSISMATASMMAKAVKGKTLEQVDAIMQKVYAMIKGEPGDYKAIGELQALAGVAKFPVRVKCATLAWHCVEEGVKEYKGGNETNG
jgi:nitrogen fixation NifU-like protein